MLSVNHISKTYPGEDLGAVNNVSFELNANEILTIVGRSGSGKSTLLQIIGGLMKPDSGEIVFHGKALENPEEQLVAGHPKIKMVFQDYKVKIGMTVEENIKYMLLNYNNAYKQERTDELLTITGLEPYRSRKTNELSGGQLQRLSIARALADEPELLLMDEPFSNLDPITKENLIMALREIIKNEKVSIVFVTHDTRDALMVSDRLIYMREGSLIQEGTVSEMYDQPINEEVASFFGRINSLESITGNKQYIRAEDMRMDIDNPDSTEMIVENCFSLGRVFLLTLSHNSRFEYYIYSERQQKVGQVVSVSYDKNRILHFS